MGSLKLTGITRRIDELGRIVIPKEIRNNLGIRDGEVLDIYVEDKKIIINKYSQVENIVDISKNICNIIGDICKVNILITDREKVIGTNDNLKNLMNQNIDNFMKKLIDDRSSYESSTKEMKLNINAYFTIQPIVTTTDSSGLIIIISESYNKEALTYAKIVQKLMVQELDVS